MFLRMLLGTLWIALPIHGAGCFLSPLPDVRTPVDRAREVEPRCARVTEESGAWMSSPDSIEAVEPALSYVQTGNDRRANLRGARIHVRPQPGQTAETMARSLECHQTRATLGLVQPLADDPYVLPGRWLDTDTESKGDEFIVLVRCDAIDDARRVLERARRFAAGHSTQSH
jgi:hypothetical protein